MILSCQHIDKSFGIKEILKDVSFFIEDKEKAALIGINGAGKSTLFKIIMNELEKDNGEVILSKGKTVGYLAQHQDYDFTNTIYDELLEVKRDIILMEEKIRHMEKEMKDASKEELPDLLESYSKLTHQFELANGYIYKSEIVGILKGLGFTEEEFSKRVSTLSGGQKTRVALGKLLLSTPDLILLDEPTNHLDMNSIAWLETFLSNYPGSVFIVSHDRYFLDRVVTKIVELENGKAHVYKGNYSTYMEKKAQLMEAKRREYENQQREIKHQEEVITKLRSFNREKSIKRAESREKLLNKIEVVEKPQQYQRTMRITLEPEIISGNDVLTVENLSKSFNHKLLFQNVEMDIKRGERVALIGDNGTGKTTILKILNKYLAADTGKFKLGSKVKIGYYDQEQQVLHDNLTIFEEIRTAYPHLLNSRIRNILAAFLFTGDDVFKPISSLSGGERGRVSLAKLMLSNANFIILDEPTNHLDIHSKEILEEALRNYTGTVLYVSHDRYFINKTATRILELTPNGLLNFGGNYDYYIEEKQKAAFASTTAEEVITAKESTSAAKEDWKKAKEEAARQRKKENDLKRVEEEISKLEEESTRLEEELALPENATNTAILIELSNKKAEIDDTLLELYEKWETLAE